METFSPKEIYPVDYAGFFDFSEDGKYGPSLLNVVDYPNAEQIANEIANRYNNHEQLVAALGDALANQEQYGYLTEAVIKEMKELLTQLESK